CNNSKSKFDFFFISGKIVLRISTTQFCKACEELIDEKADEPDSVEKFPFLNSQKVHDAFRPKIFDPSLRPPQTLTVSEVDKKPMVGTTENLAAEGMSVFTNQLAILIHRVLEKGVHDY
ncbi:uncharacterized protein CDAR_9331, partial [Caerostris darwini]